MDADFRLETARLWILPWQAADADALYPILSDAPTMQFWPQPFDHAGVEAWIQRNLQRYAEDGFGRWRVVEKLSGKVIGDAGIVRTEIAGQMENDLGYIIHAGHWRKGYGLEAAQACLEYGWNALKMKRIVANMAHDHTASRRVAERLGMHLEKRFANARNRGILTDLWVASQD